MANNQSNQDDPQAKRNMVPTFLGVLSKTPPHVQAEANNQTEIPHPFSQSVPKLKKPPAMGARPQINPGRGGQVFSTTPNRNQMKLSPPTPGRDDYRKVRNNFQEVRDNVL